MALKDDLLDFLKSHPNKKFSVNELFQEINKIGIKTSYPTVLKNVDILIAQGSIKVTDYNVLKLVWYEKGN